jgi:DNA invertase Pin-like site-specific DNA recombinase
MNSVTSPRVFGYARVSTYEQKLSGLGLDTQRVAIDVEAARHGWTVEHHADEGVSGSVRPEDRPELGRILNEITAGDVLVVAKLDRLGRSALDVLRLAETARANGWRLVLLDLGLDTATPVGAFTLTALAAVAQLERDLIAQRTKAALTRSAGVLSMAPRCRTDLLAAFLVSEQACTGLAVGQKRWVCGG